MTSYTLTPGGNARFVVPEPTNRLFVEITSASAEIFLAASMVAVGDAHTDDTDTPAERMQRLRELAEWSVTKADLDWEHADRIGEHAWGQH